jgi:hypothetical protein
LEGDILGLKSDSATTATRFIVKEDQMSNKHRPTLPVVFSPEVVAYYGLPVQPGQVITLVDAELVLELLCADDFIDDATLAEAEEHFQKRTEALISLRFTLCDTGPTRN